MRAAGEMVGPVISLARNVSVSIINFFGIFFLLQSISYSVFKTSKIDIAF